MKIDLRRKPRVFIGASVEHLALALAVQQNFEPSIEATVWNQNVFRASEYPIDELLRGLANSDFGVFIAAPVDRATVRNRRHSVLRDNIIFEFGMFVGQLGRHRAFLVVPRERKDLRLPSDWAGLIAGEYDADRQDGNVRAALGPVSEHLTQIIGERFAESMHAASGVVGAGLFVADYVGRFNALIGSANRMRLLFIHSRRWRENHVDAIRMFLERDDTQLEVFLPDIRLDGLIRVISDHFADESEVPSLIRGAYEFFARLMMAFPGRVKVALFPRYPAYSGYWFDDRAIIAFYPNARAKRDVPTLEVASDSVLGSFFADDLKSLLQESYNCGVEEMAQLGGMR
ncbi:MAG: TIR domain-containing protein [Minisyncoccota bacterium]